MKNPVDRNHPGPSPRALHAADLSRQAAPARCALALFLALAPAAHVALATDGALDPSWAPRISSELGVPGLIEDTYNLGGGGTFNGDMSANAVIVQPDGKVLVAGFAWNTANGIDQNACVLRRFLADGSYDAGFGNDGAIVQNWISTDPVNPKLDCYLNSVALQPDGKILAAGQLVFGSGSTPPSGLVERYNANGTLDTTFASNGAEHFATDLTQVLSAPDGNVYVAGSYQATGFTDNDFYLGVLDPNGAQLYYRSWHFDLGGDRNDLPVAAVLQRWFIQVGGTFHNFEELYLVGVADDAAYADGLGRHSCAIAALRREDAAPFDYDDSFNGTSQLAVEFPVGISETDTVCRSAARRAGNSLFGPTGVVVGGERYFNSPSGLASYWALEDIDPSGSVQRDDDFGFFEDLNEGGAFNALFGLAWDDTGKLVGVGYDGLGASANPAHAPSDMGLVRFNADYSVDPSFGDGGKAILSLDDAGGALLPSQREWGLALAMDPVHARAIVVGERSPWLAAFPNKYYWLLGAVHEGVQQISDRIFADGFE
jgi:uncharacterized delta-60 repeat protein